MNKCNENRSLWRSWSPIETESGLVTIELIAAVPVLLAIILGTFHIGRTSYLKQKLLTSASTVARQCMLDADADCQELADDAVAEFMDEEEQACEGGVEASAARIEVRPAAGIFTAEVVFHCTYRVNEIYLPRWSGTTLEAKASMPYWAHSGPSALNEEP